MESFLRMNQHWKGTAEKKKTEISNIGTEVNGKRWYRYLLQFRFIQPFFLIVLLLCCEPVIRITIWNCDILIRATISHIFNKISQFFDSLLSINLCFVLSGFGFDSLKKEFSFCALYSMIFIANAHILRPE